MRATTERELHEREKLFLTPESSDSSPHCQSYERNERSMLDFEGRISELSIRSKDRVAFENDTEDVISELAYAMASVTANDWEDNIDSNVSVAFSVPPSLDQNSNLSSDVAFSEAINLRGEMSILSVSFESFNVFSEHYSVLDIGKPSFSRCNEVEPTLELVLNLEEL